VIFKRHFRSSYRWRDAGGFKILYDVDCKRMKWRTIKHVAAGFYCGLDGRTIYFFLLSFFPLLVLLGGVAPKAIQAEDSNCTL
jgi:hypothetical protein